MIVLYICIFLLSSSSVYAQECLPLGEAYQESKSLLVQAEKEHRDLKVIHKEAMVTETQEEITYHQLSDDHPVYQAADEVARLIEQKRNLRNDMRICQLG